MSVDFRVLFAEMDPQAIVGPEELAVLMHRSVGAITVLAHRGRLPRRAFPTERKLCWFAGDIREWLAAARAEQLESKSPTNADSSVGATKAERRRGRPRFGVE